MVSSSVQTLPTYHSWPTKIWRSSRIKTPWITSRRGNIPDITCRVASNSILSFKDTFMTGIWQVYEFFNRRWSLTSPPSCNFYFVTVFCKRIFRSQWTCIIFCDTNCPERMIQGFHPLPVYTRYQPLFTHILLVIVWCPSSILYWLKLIRLI